MSFNNNNNNYAYLHLCNHLRRNLSEQKLQKFIVKISQSRIINTIYFQINTLHMPLRAKKVVSDSSGLVDFATGQVNSVQNLLDGQVKFSG